MKKIKIFSNDQVLDNKITVTMYIKPTFYEGSSVFSNVTFNRKTRRYHTDVNPKRKMTGPLSKPGEDLEYPIRQEWEAFIHDCLYVIKEVGFTVISETTSETSKKSEYIILFGMKNKPCGTLVFDLRISDHPFDAKFPEEAKEQALEYLKVNKILDANILKDRVNFGIEKVTVGGVVEDTWDRAFNRLYDVLKRMSRKVKRKLKEEKNH